MRCVINFISYWEVPQDRTPPNYVAPSQFLSAGNDGKWRELGGKWRELGGKWREMTGNQNLVYLLFTVR